MVDEIIRLFEYFTEHPIVQGAFIGYGILALICFALVISIFIFTLVQINKKR